MAIGTFGSFTQARLAIYAAQTGLSITGNNISNINTTGYTRQRLDQNSLHVGGSDRYANPADVRTGQGVLCSGVSQLRDPYLDIRYRTANADVGYMDTKLGGLESIASILDEVGKGEQTEGDDFGILGARISDLYKVLGNLTTETGHAEFDRQVRSVAEEVTKLFNKYASNLQEEYDNAVMSIEKDVEHVNGLLTDIRGLNEEIRRCEIYGDKALELRDHRNVLLDELSSYVKINAVYTMEEIAPGLEVEKLTVKLDDANPDGHVTTDESVLVDGIFGGQISINQVPKPNPNRLPYLDKNGDPTDDPDQAKQIPVPNPKYDNTVTDTNDPAFGQYLKADGTGGTNNKNLAAKEPEKNPDDKPYLDSKDNPVADEKDAQKINNDNFDMTISELRDKKGVLMYTQTKPETVKLDPTNPDHAADIAAAEAFVNANKKQPEEAVDTPAKLDSTFTSYVRNADGTYSKITYQKIASKKVPLDDNDLYGSLQAERELLTENGDFTDLETITGTDLSCDEKAGVKRGFRYYQRSLDLLANKFAEAFNEANQGFYTDKSGNYIGTVLDENGVPKVDERTGKTIGGPVVVEYDTGEKDPGTGDPVMAEYTLKKGDTKDSLDPKVWEAMEKKATDAGKTIETVEDYLKLPQMKKTEVTTTETDPNDPNATITKTEEKWVPIKTADGKETTYTNATFVGGPLFSNHGSGNETTDPQITAANISISHGWNYEEVELVRDYECAPGEAEPASGASLNILHMQGLLTEKRNFIPNELETTPGATGDVMFRGSFSEMWENIGSVLANDQNITSTLLETSYQSATEIDTSRDSVSSVDFNDEAMNLMMYAKSYNAACRLMTTIDTVLDKLINNTGVTT